MLNPEMHLNVKLMRSQPRGVDDTSVLSDCDRSLLHVIGSICWHHSQPCTLHMSSIHCQGRELSLSTDGTQTFLSLNSIKSSSVAELEHTMASELSANTEADY